MLPPILSAEALRDLARRPSPQPRDRCGCRALSCAGWITLSGGFDQSQLRLVGRLGSGDPYDEPTFSEYHPDGTRNESANAPIALAFFPYNRCEVWSCVDCARLFLRYTEFGGYYIDHRIREVNPDLVVDPVDPVAT